VFEYGTAFALLGVYPWASTLMLQFVSGRLRKQASPYLDVLAVRPPTSTRAPSIALFVLMSLTVTLREAIPVKLISASF